MQVIVNKKFYDIKNKKIRKRGDSFECDEKRYEEIKSFVEANVEANNDTKNKKDKKQS